MNRTFLKLITACLLVQQSQCALITTVNNFDPQPLYTAHYPNSFFTWAQKAHLHGIDKQPYTNRFNVSFTPFFQRANKGTDIFGNHQAALGDLTGTVNVLATLPFTQTPPTVPPYVDIPCGYTANTLLQGISSQLLADIATIFNPNPYPTDLKTIQGLLEVQQAATPSNLKNIGCIEANLKYRKYGFRFNGEVYLCGGFGLVFATGFSSIDQTPQLKDTTLGAANANFPIPTDASTSSASSITHDQWLSVLNVISQDVVARTSDIGNAINQRLNGFFGTSVEDINLDLFWRGLIPTQRQRQIIPGQAPDTYASYCVMPFAALGGTIPVAKKRDITDIFSVPFGDDGFYAIRGRLGTALDFYETIEICGEFGVTYFFPRTIANLPIPTNIFQNGLYPFVHDAQVKPGKNIHIALGMYAYHFVEMVSAYVTYVFINHAENQITLTPPPLSSGTNCNPNAFLPNTLAEKTPWQVHLVNASLCVDLSPAARGYLLVQIPVSRTNAARSTTWAVSLEVGF